MPGFNRTGPRSMGPMTGGARGLCNPWGRGIGRVTGRGYGVGRGRGFGPGWGQAYQTPYSYDSPIYPSSTRMSREDEISLLQDQAQSIKEQLEQIDSRIRQLSGEKGV